MEGGGRPPHAPSSVSRRQTIQGVAVILERLTSHDAAGIGAMAATFGSPVASGEVVFRFSRSIAKEEEGQDHVE